MRRIRPNLETRRIIRVRALTALLAAGSAAACEPDCERLDSVFAVAVGRPESPPDDADLVWTSGDGGLSVRSAVTDQALFEPILDHVFAGTSSTVGMLRWGLVLGRDRALVVEHAVPLEDGEVFDVDVLLDDLEFTGGRGTETWWDTSWRWEPGTSTTAARAVLTEAFETVLTTTDVRGQIEVRQIAPLELRVGLSFASIRGRTEAFWSDVEFDAAFGFEPCGR